MVDDPVRNYEDALSAFKVIADEFFTIRKDIDYEGINKAVNDYANEIGAKRIHVTPGPGATPENVVAELRRVRDTQIKFNAIPEDFRQKFMISKLKSILKDIMHITNVAYTYDKQPEYDDLISALRDIWGICDMAIVTTYYPDECVNEWRKKNGYNLESKSITNKNNS